MRTSPVSLPRSLAALGACALAVAAAPTAHAHAGGPGASGFLSGLAHPISGLDHVLAMVAVGMWGAQLGGRATWLLPAVFLLSMALGGAAPALGVAVPGVEVGIAASAVLLGLAVLRAWRPRTRVAALLACAFAVFHGHAHGTEMPPGADGGAYAAGFVVATAMLHAAGTAVGAVRRPAGRLALRAAGLLVAAGGAFFLWSAIA
jgi:urease accessory protein